MSSTYFQISQSKTLFLWLQSSFSTGKVQLSQDPTIRKKIILKVATSFLGTTQLVLYEQIAFNFFVKMIYQIVSIIASHLHIYSVLYTSTAENHYVGVWLERFIFFFFQNKVKHVEYGIIKKEHFWFKHMQQLLMANIILGRNLSGFTLINRWMNYIFKLLHLLWFKK